MEELNKEINGFSALGLSPEIMRAITDLGYDMPTDIQSQAIPLMRSGRDIIGRSQTGTGKTMAFAIPAIEMIRASKDKSGVLAIVLLPTRELAIQCCGEIKKLTRYCEGIRPVEVYGGAPMDRQITRLKKANIVVGTPGRIMDHLRRRTLKLDKVKLAVLDEADEMLSMGFKEDMETILRETPSERQTVLFSATMPEEILSITDEFLYEPEKVEIDSLKVTVDNIIQNYIDVPMGRKTDALRLLLYYFDPSLSIVFCNTKKTSEEVASALIQSGFSAEVLHGDLKQSQRTNVMDKFRSGIINILVATDVAARGIDVNDVTYVFNYDIPQNNEYYVHRIGRTGRVGKEGHSVTICSGKRQVFALQNIAHSVRSTISEIKVPTSAEVNNKAAESNLSAVEAAISSGIPDRYGNMVNLLLAKGYSLFDIAACGMKMNFEDRELKIKDIRTDKKSSGSQNTEFARIMLNIGRSSRVAPNHLVASITERSMLHGGDIGKIEIYDDFSVVAVPSVSAEDVIDMMYGAKVCGRPVSVTLYEEKPSRSKGKSGSHEKLRQDNRRKKPAPHSAVHRHDRKKAAKRHGK